MVELLDGDLDLLDVCEKDEKLPRILRIKRVALDVVDRLCEVVVLLGEQDIRPSDEPAVAIDECDVARFDEVPLVLYGGAQKWAMSSSYASRSR